MTNTLEKIFDTVKDKDNHGNTSVRCSDFTVNDGGFGVFALCNFSKGNLLRHI
jgi:hypothetical protein